MSDGFREVVVGTDGSRGAERAVDAAATLSAAVGARVHAVSVVAGGADRTPAEAYVTAARSRLDDAGVESVGAVREGAPDETLIEYADEHDVDVVVLGVQGRRGLRRALLGSVTESVARSGGRPVVTVRAGADVEGLGDLDRLLVGTDGSEAAEDVERLAITLADAVGATLDVVTVVDTAHLTVGSAPVGIEGEAVRVVREGLVERGRNAVDAVTRAATEAGVATDSAVLEGTPTRQLRARARETDADLVMVGTHGRSGVERLLLGSVAERVVRTADRPVLVVPADGADTGPDAAGRSADDAGRGTIGDDTDADGGDADADGGDTDDGAGDTSAENEAGR